MWVIAISFGLSPPLLSVASNPWLPPATLGTSTAIIFMHAYLIQTSQGRVVLSRWGFAIE